MTAGRSAVTTVVVVTLGLLPAQRDAGAQHAPLLDAAAPLEYQGCGMCHGAHGSGSDTRMLRVDEQSASNLGRSGGNISRSCLRCHLTASDRIQQPEVRSASGGLDRALLGLDVTDDHPIGSGLGDDPFSGSVLDDALRAPTSGRLESLSMFDDSVVECTTCHDPHDRSGPVPRLEEEIGLCTSCHEGGRYAFSSHQGIPCSACHSLHRGHGQSLLRDPDIDTMCATCHSGTGATGLTSVSETGTGRMKALASIVGSRMLQGHVSQPEGQCVECHPVHR